MQTETLISRPAPEVAVPLRAERQSWGTLAAVGTAIALVGAWLIVAPRTPDLAAQAYRSGLYSHLGMVVWDNNWYGGHHMPGYSLIYQPLSALLGLRIVGALAVVASAALFSRIASSAFGPGTAPAAIWFAVAAAGDVWIGRLTFALGVTFALGAVLALMEAERRAGDAERAARGLEGAARDRLNVLLLGLGMLCAALSAATSPVAGLLLALAAGTHIVVTKRLKPGILLIGAVLLIVLPLEGLFPEGGFEPYGWESLAASLAVSLAFIWALPKGERLLLAGGWLFVLVDLLGLLPTPMGSNVVRYAALLAGPLLLCALARAEGGAMQPSAALARAEDGVRRPSSALMWTQRGARRPAWALALVLVGIAFWVAWGPITQTEGVLHDPSTTASYYLPLREFLARHVDRPVRIEVPFTRSHWEAALLAPHVSLARGWERQLDKRFDEAIEADPLPPSVYKRWLYYDAVSYVALPDVPLDGSSLGEAALIRKGVPFLREVDRTKHWRIFSVIKSRPLAQGPGRIVSLRHQSFVLLSKKSGRFLVRVHYTPYWQVSSRVGSVSEAAGDWTQVSVRRAGLITVRASFSLSSAIGLL